MGRNKKDWCFQRIFAADGKKSAATFGTNTEQRQAATLRSTMTGMAKPKAHRAPGPESPVAKNQTDGVDEE